VKGKKSGSSDHRDDEPSLSSGSSPLDVSHHGYPDQGLVNNNLPTAPLPQMHSLDNPRVGPPPDALVSRTTAKTSPEYVEKFIPIEEATAQIRSIAVRDLHQEPTASDASSQRSRNNAGSENGDSSSMTSRESSSKKSIHRISPSSLQDMRRVSKQLQCDTTWFRVVHSGYGQDAWRVAVQSHGLTVIRAHSPAEGTYVRIPEDTSPEDMVLCLTDINLNVRKKTRFKDMNRANKSRLQFKVEPFVVSVASDGEKPALVHTTRFAGLASQKDDDSEVSFSADSSGSRALTSVTGFSGSLTDATSTAITGSTMDDSVQREEPDSPPKSLPGKDTESSWTIRL
jgi:hypothetical protein